MSKTPVIELPGQVKLRVLEVSANLSNIQSRIASETLTLGNDYSDHIVEDVRIAGVIQGTPGKVLVEIRLRPKGLALRQPS